MKVLVTVLALAVAGCWSYSENVMKGYVGEPADKLIAKWGPPDNEAKLADGGRVLEWRGARNSAACISRFMVGPDDIVRDYSHVNCN